MWRSHLRQIDPLGSFMGVNVAGYQHLMTYLIQERSLIEKLRSREVSTWEKTLKEKPIMTVFVLKPREILDDLRQVLGSKSISMFHSKRF
jgi:hypothetical protein